MKISILNGHELSVNEKVALYWLGEQRGLTCVRVARISKREYDLRVHGLYHDSSPAFDSWFPMLALAEFKKLALCTYSMPMPFEKVWEFFGDVVKQRRRLNPLGFSSGLYSAIHATWQAVNPDAGAVDNHEAIFIVIDANRMSMYGDDGKADSELDWFIKHYGYEPTLRALDKFVQLV